MPKRDDTLHTRNCEASKIALNPCFPHSLPDKWPTAESEKYEGGVKKSDFESMQMPSCQELQRDPSEPHASPVFR